MSVTKLLLVELKLKKSDVDEVKKKVSVNSVVCDLVSVPLLVREATMEETEREVDREDSGSEKVAIFEDENVSDAEMMPEIVLERDRVRVFTLTVA